MKKINYQRFGFFIMFGGAFLWSASTQTMAATGAMGSDKGLFSYKGKTYHTNDLSVANQQRLSDLESEYFKNLTAFLDTVILEQHVLSVASKSAKKVEEIEHSLFDTDPPSDKEQHDWFEANKGRLPPDYTFERVKGDISRHLSQEKGDQKKAEVLKSLKANGEVIVMVPEPQAPLIAINIKDRPFKGPINAPLTLVEFADYQCPHCRVAAKAIDKILKKHSTKVKFVFLDFPINPSGISRQVAKGAYCANLQGKYWEFHDLAYEQQGSLTMNSPESLAGELGLKTQEFATCLKGDAAKKKVDFDQAEGQRVGVEGTPSLFLNGKKVRSYEESELENAFEKTLKGSASNH